MTNRDNAGGERDDGAGMRMTFRLHVGRNAMARIDDEMTELELVLLEESLVRGLADIKAGRYRSADDVLAEFRRLR